MIRRRDALRKLALIPFAAGASTGLLALAGCGNEGAPVIPLNKSKEEAQKESEQLPGIPVKDTPGTKKRR
jgi:hypothetical protein